VVQSRASVCRRRSLKPSRRLTLSVQVSLASSFSAIPKTQFDANWAIKGVQFGKADRDKSSLALAASMSGCKVSSVWRRMLMERLKILRNRNRMFDPAIMLGVNLLTQWQTVAYRCRSRRTICHASRSQITIQKKRQPIFWGPRCCARLSLLPRCYVWDWPIAKTAPAHPGIWRRGG